MKALAVIRHFFSDAERERRRIARARRSLRSQLEKVWEDRKELNTRENYIKQRMGFISAYELHNSIPTRSARGW